VVIQYAVVKSNIDAIMNNESLLQNINIHKGLKKIYTTRCGQIAVI